MCYHVKKVIDKKKQFLYPERLAHDVVSKSENPVFITVSIIVTPDKSKTHLRPQAQNQRVAGQFGIVGV